MSDIYDKKKRSEVMSRVRARDTAPEMAVRRLLHRRGFRYRLHPANLPGRPDIVLPRYRIAVFVNGCFWHRHTCGKGNIPKTSTQFWKKKLNRNVERDRERSDLLQGMGYRVITVWECEVKNEKRFEDRMIREITHDHESRPGQS